MNKKLRFKILMGALVLVFVSCAAITIVVSVLINKQNRDLVHQNITKSLTVVQNSLVDREAAFLDVISQMATVNKIGDVIKFLIDYNDSGLNMMRPSFEKITNMLANTAIIENLLSIRVYSNDGLLINFYEQKDDQNSVMGYQHQSKFYFRSFKTDESYDKVKYAEGASIDGIDLPTQYPGAMPDKPAASFDHSDRYLKLKTVVPIYTNFYNDKTEQVEKGQIGFAVAEERLAKSFVESMDKITGMQMNLFVGDAFSSGEFSDYKKVDVAGFPKSVETLWTIKTAQFYFNDVRLSSGMYFQGLIPVYSGEKFIGGMLILQSDAILKANTRQMIFMISAVALAIMVLVIPLAFFAAGTLVKPLVDIVEKLKDIAEGEGDLTCRLTVKSKDEIGQVAQWFNTFIDKIHTLISDVSVNAKELNEASTRLARISKTMAKGAEQTAENSNSVSAAVEQMSVSMTSVAASMEQSTGNMGMVASATEEMNNTISEISKNTVFAKEITEDVVIKTDAASGQIGELGSAAGDIGHVVGVITDISDQVSLLALNATIEAARAGEAGKGFAVVANEIKDLATQTADATKEITDKVGKIRNSSEKTVEQITRISHVANKVNEIVLIIASAVEEQSATTQDISDNIVRVTQGMDKINDNVSQSSTVSTEIAREITEVTQAANEMTQNSEQVDVGSKDLSGLAEKLTELVNKFNI